MKKNKISTNIFVYGTLRIGERNFKRNFYGEFNPNKIYEDAFVKGYIIKGIIPMRNSTTYICPRGIVPYAIKTNLTTRVKGNLFQFFDRDRKAILKLLKELDYFEGHPNFYKRRIENVYYNNDVSKFNYEHCKAFMYEYNTEKFNA